MLRLFSIIFALASTVLMGSLIVVALATGYDTFKPIIAAALGGLVIAIPIAWWISNKLYSLK